MIFLSLAFALKHKESQRKARTFSNFQEAAVVDTKTQIAVTPLSLYFSEVSIASSRSERWKFSFPNSKKLQNPDSPVVDMKT